MSRGEVARSYGGVSAEERRADRRRRLLAAGRAAWADSGPTGVKVRGICALSGLTDRYFYEHFANRDALLLAVADDVRDQLLTAMVQAGLAAEGDAAVKLRAALQSFLDTAQADPQIMRIVTSDTAGIPGLAERRHDVLATIADLVVEHAPAVLAVDDHDPAQLRRAAMFVTGGVNQLIEAWLDGAITMSTADLAAECTRMCLAVIRNRG
ncbi:TetR/AcrR family transcriptional regulator [Nocardia sp. 2]|uniref:TetR/AcrR family transcriptional regulator n=1 Tax=Nocardia acididurans TaxID=2802282 RepID=A0ABS1M7Y7_9NOCA|nr:TetR/AcrR family transcriptional regulator [Nocardia acididurans]MBL1076324.1 TetR/AcrR family transcriptional regulator [Nocardia acididurans]